MARSRIEVGAVYETVGAFPRQWQVDEVIEKPGHPPHVRLRARREGRDVRLFSTTVLSDREKFRPLGRDGAGA